MYGLLGRWEYGHWYRSQYKSEDEYRRNYTGML
jgi:hypothetical protein